MTPVSPSGYAKRKMARKNEPPDDDDDEEDEEEEEERSLDHIFNEWLQCPGCDEDGRQHIAFDGELLHLKCEHCHTEMTFHGFNLEGFPDP